MTRKLEIPKELWCQFVNVLYAAVEHIEPTEENKECMGFIRNQIQKTIEDGEVLVVSGKIVDRNEFINGILNAKEKRKTILSN